MNPLVAKKGFEGPPSKEFTKFGNHFLGRIKNYLKFPTSPNPSPKNGPF